MAGKSFGGSRAFVLGALWWFALSAAMGLLHRLWPDLVETPLVVVIAVAVALLGTFAITYLVRTK